MTKKKVPETPEEKVNKLETKQGQIAEKVGELKQSVDGFHSALSAMGKDLVGKMEGLFGQTQLRLDDVERKQDRATEADAARRKAEEEPVVAKETPILFASTEKAQTEATLAAANKIQGKAAAAAPPPPPTATATASSIPWWKVLVLAGLLGTLLFAVIILAGLYWGRPNLSAVAVNPNQQTQDQNPTLKDIANKLDGINDRLVYQETEISKIKDNLNNPSTVDSPSTAVAVVVPTTTATIATPVPTTPAPIDKTGNGLVNPVLFDAGNSPPEEKGGSFDIGVKENQVGVVFGYGIKWDKGGKDLGADGGKLVILRPGWYENLWILDGRYEVYDVPSGDYEGWLKVLGTQRADEQTADYGIVKKQFSDIPQWTSPVVAPPK